MAGEVLAFQEAGEGRPRVGAGEFFAQRAVAGDDEAGAGPGGADGLPGAEKQRVVFFGGEAADVDEHRVVGTRAPGGAQGGIAFGGGEEVGVHAAREQAHAAKAVARELGVELVGRRQGDAGAVVEPAQVGEGGAGEKRETVVARVAVEVGVKGGGQRDAQRVGGGEGGPAQRALGGDVHDIGPAAAPGAQQGPARGQAEAQHGVAGDGHARVQDLAVGAVGHEDVGAALARAVHGDLDAAAGEAGGELPERHGDAVDLGREGFGDEGEFHACDGDSSCVGGYAMAKPGAAPLITFS